MNAKNFIWQINRMFDVLHLQYIDLQKHENCFYLNWILVLFCFVVSNLIIKFTNVAWPWWKNEIYIIIYFHLTFIFCYMQVFYIQIILFDTNISYLFQTFLPISLVRYMMPSMKILSVQILLSLTKPKIRLFWNSIHVRNI